MVFETTSAVGTSLLIFGVFPRLDLIKSILIINSVSLLPGFVKLLLEFRNDNNKKNLIELFLRKLLRPFKKLNKLLLISMNFTALAMQLSFIFIVLIIGYGKQSSWLVVLAIILISISLTFAHFNPTSQKHSSRKLLYLQQIRSNIFKAQHKIGLFTNLWKVGIVLAFSQLFYPSFRFQVSVFESQMSCAQRLAYFMPFVIQIASSLIFYLACSLAFKLRMSRISYALPLCLITPVCVAFVFALNHADNIPDFLIFVKTNGYTYNYLTDLLCGLILWWLSNLWITGHMWNNQKTSINITIKR